MFIIIMDLKFNCDEKRLISVIIPVYNTKPYLNACVESVVGQTYRELEIILVDDGSTDGSGELCDEWAKKDPCIQVIHKANGGQGEARNMGMEIAAGEYIGFVDSDDVISPRMYETLIAAMEQYHADMVQCAMFQFSELPLKRFPESKAVSITELCGGEKWKCYFLTHRITSTCPSVLIKAKIAKKIPFDLGMKNEDVMWIYRAVRDSGKVLLTDEVLYAYYQRPGSTMNSAYSERKFDAMKANRMLSDAVKREVPAYYPYSERGFAGSCMYHYQWLCRLPDSEEYRGYRERLHRMFLSADLKAVYSVTGPKNKIWYTMFRKMPAMTCRIRNLLRIGL